MIEREKTYLARYLPDGLETFSCKEIFDLYLPATSQHPTLRVRKNGTTLEITKKRRINNDPSEQVEETISLDTDEFETLISLPGKKVHKMRYFYPYEKLTAEVDIFLDNLKGLVLVDFEFSSTETKNAFHPPDFCLADVTHEDVFAGGMLCGRSYSDIEDFLKKFQYTPLHTDDMTSRQ